MLSILISYCKALPAFPSWCWISAFKEWACTESKKFEIVFSFKMGTTTLTFTFHFFYSPLLLLLLPHFRFLPPTRLFLPPYYCSCPLLLFLPPTRFHFGRKCLSENFQNWRLGLDARRCRWVAEQYFCWNFQVIFQKYNFGFFRAFTNGWGLGISPATVEPWLSGLVSLVPFIFHEY